MGTRADFYVGRGAVAEWLGSIAFDGYPSGVDKSLLESATETEFRDRLAKFVAPRGDWTSPEMGWPWPWNDSGTTDYAYAFDDGVWASNFGYEWFKADGPEPTEDEEEAQQKTAVFPDMSAKKAVTFGPRSGLVVISREV